MKITIHYPLALNELGGRENNEDSIFPQKGKATAENNLFLVCDGVGGFEKGEIASEIACISFPDFFGKNPVKVSTPDYIKNALKFVETTFDDYIKEQPETKGMATTLTLLHFHEAGATVAHCGDSRVYQVRNGKIIHKTDDHSYLNQMVKSGAMTKEEAVNHPKKNVIVRAIQGASIKPTEVDAEILTDIQINDYFFLCTDGILENISDDILTSVLSKDNLDEEKIKEIHSLCHEKTKDNFSAYLIKIKAVEGEAPKEFIKQNEPVTAEVVEEEEIFDAQIVSEKEQSKEKNILTKFADLLKKKSDTIWVITLVIIAIIVGYAIFSGEIKIFKENTTEQADSLKNQKTDSTIIDKINKQKDKPIIKKNIPEETDTIKTDTAKVDIVKPDTLHKDTGQINKVLKMVNDKSTNQNTVK